MSDFPLAIRRMYDFDMPSVALLVFPPACEELLFFGLGPLPDLDYRAIGRDEVLDVVKFVDVVVNHHLPAVGSQKRSPRGEFIRRAGIFALSATLMRNSAL